MQIARQWYKRSCRYDGVVAYVVGCAEQIRIIVCSATFNISPGTSMNRLQSWYKFSLRWYGSKWILFPAVGLKTKAKSSAISSLSTDSPIEHFTGFDFLPREAIQRFQDRKSMTYAFSLQSSAIGSCQSNCESLHWYRTRKVAARLLFS